jgi:hypothetical protein
MSAEIVSLDAFKEEKRRKAIVRAFLAILSAVVVGTAATWVA